MEIKYRQIQKEEYPESENVIREAFWNYYAPGCSEHYLMYIMRNSPKFIHELDIVAVNENQIVGQIAFVEGTIKSDDGKEYKVLSLGPIGVLPEYQHLGIGAKLIEHAYEIASKLDYRAILLCGNPAFYEKQGFVPAKKFNIRNAENYYVEALQIRELYENSMANISGQYYEDEIYFFDETKVDEFDAKFPPKEKVEGNESQQFFNEFVQRVEKYNQ